MPLRRKGGERKPTADLICSLTSSQIDQVSSLLLRERRKNAAVSKVFLRG